MTPQFGELVAWVTEKGEVMGSLTWSAASVLIDYPLSFVITKILNTELNSF